jgi:hypothetical protein
MLKFHNKPFELIEPFEHHLRVEYLQPLQPLQPLKPHKPQKPHKPLFLLSHTLKPIELPASPLGDRGGLPTILPNRSIINPKLI